MRPRRPLLKIRGVYRRTLHYQIRQLRKSGNAATGLMHGKRRRFLMRRPDKTASTSTEHFERLFRIAERAGDVMVTNVTQRCEDAVPLDGQPNLRTAGTPPRGGCIWPSPQHRVRRTSCQSQERKTADRSRIRPTLAWRAG